MKNTREFLKSSYKNIRSSKRTDVLHNAILEDNLIAEPKWRKFTWKHEYKLKEDGRGGTFAIDIAGFDENNKLKIAILAKSLCSNINKNIKNYANTTSGEVERITCSPLIDFEALEKIIFFTALPRLAPRFNKKGVVTGVDDVVKAKKRSHFNHVRKRNPDWSKVSEVNLWYDIDKLDEKKNKSDFNEIDVVNLEKIVL